MELHMVFSNTDYDNDSSLYTKSDALVVLASFFEATDEDNPVYAEIVDKLNQIHMPDQSANLPFGFTIRSMLPESTENYFTYKGSLTTPPCLEVVTWIDFKHPIRLSHNQVLILLIMIIFCNKYNNGYNDYDYVRYYLPYGSKICYLLLYFIHKK